MRDAGVEPDTTSYNTAINASKDGLLRVAQIGAWNRIFHVVGFAGLPGQLVICLVFVTCNGSG